MTTQNNSALWDSVCKTDPKYTKDFSRSGGFKGTAINPTYQTMRATEAFGPVGVNWGWEVEKEDYMNGCNGEIVHVLRIKFWYRITKAFSEMILGNAEDLIGAVCSFPCYGQTTFVGKNKNGLFTDEEAPKKSLTDALSKALSFLGFSADIHLGLYDSNKYVNDRRAEFGNDEKSPSTTKTTEKAPAPPKQSNVATSKTAASPVAGNNKTPASSPATAPTATTVTWNDATKKMVSDKLNTLKTIDEIRKYWSEFSVSTGITRENNVDVYSDMLSVFNSRITVIRADNAKPQEQAQPTQAQPASEASNDPAQEEKKAA